jgi:CubicO group peptidase (beta-lactamase class C family)
MKNPVASSWWHGKFELLETQGGAGMGSQVPLRTDSIFSLALVFDPGSRWAYSNGPGFELLGRVAEVASGQGFRALLRERLFAPLGMVDTDFGVAQPASTRAVAVLGARAPAAESTT